MCLQCNWLRTTIPELCGMCPLTASDWNLHSWNNCSTQSVVVYCHSESKSSADCYTGGTRKRDRGRIAERRCCLKPRQNARATHTLIVFNMKGWNGVISLNYQIIFLRCEDSVDLCSLPLFLQMSLKLVPIETMDVWVWYAESAQTWFYEKLKKKSVKISLSVWCIFQNTGCWNIEK